MFNTMHQAECLQAQPQAQHDLQHEPSIPKSVISCTALIEACMHAKMILGINPSFSITLRAMHETVMQSEKLCRPIGERYVRQDDAQRGEVF